MFAKKIQNKIIWQEFDNSKSTLIEIQSKYSQRHYCIRAAYSN